MSDEPTQPTPGRPGKPGGTDNVALPQREVVAPPARPIATDVADVVTHHPVPAPVPIVGTGIGLTPAAQKLADSGGGLPPLPPDEDDDDGDDDGEGGDGRGARGRAADDHPSGYLGYDLDGHCLRCGAKIRLDVQRARHDAFHDRMGDGYLVPTTADEHADYEALTGRPWSE